MTVRVVTDSGADIAPDLACELSITIIPNYVHFGTSTYRNGIDITASEFYPRLAQKRPLPTTSSVSPGAYAEVFNRIAAEANEIISLHLPTQLSAGFNSASVARDWVKECRIEVIDTGSASIGMGLVAIEAARLAQQGASLEEVVAMVRGLLPRLHLLALLETTEYALKGGRLGKAGLILGSIVKIRALIRLRQGEVHPVGIARTRRKAIDRIYEWVQGFPSIRELAIAHSAAAEEAQGLADRLGSIFPRERIYVSVISPALGTHTGPGALGVALIEDR